MYSIRHLLILLAISTAIGGCKPKHVHNIKTGFYYWKTVYAPTGSEKDIMAAVKTGKAYIRFFDIDWDMANGEATPQAVVRFPSTLDSTQENIPVVFITQQAISTLKPGNVPGLASKISKLVSSICADGNIQPRELQIDCDWTTASKDTYFLLLQELRKQDFFEGKLLSCTIRLHQIKYRLKSGIPPVDRGMLMCYNVGDLKQPTAENSILDVALVKNYLEHLDTYPLRLDVALPLFRWCVLFRKGVFGGIIRDADPDEMSTSIFKKQRSNFYSVGIDTVWHGYMLRRGDIIRAESPTVQELKEVAYFTSRHLSNDTTTVAFFHSDSLTLSHYTSNELKTILDTYH